MKIRPYQAGDEVGIAEAHRRSILELCIKDYTPAQVGPWAQPTEDPQRYVRSIEKNNERFWVVDDHGMIGGFAGWYDNEIQGFYMHPEYVGKGLAKQLFKAIEQEFWLLSGCEECIIHSTRTAKPFYQKMGFEVHEPYIHRFAGGSVEVEGWVMKKRKSQ